MKSFLFWAGVANAASALFFALGTLDWSGVRSITQQPGRFRQIKSIRGGWCLLCSG